MKTRLFALIISATAALLMSTSVGVHASPPLKTEADIVYITKTGSKYHRHSCMHLRYSAIPIERYKALQINYEPCKVCRP